MACGKKGNADNTGNSKIAVYPGSFDPVTLGHLDLVRKALRIFDKVVMAVAENPGKKPFFPLARRVHMLKEVTRDFSRVEVVTFSGTLVEYLKTRGIFVVIRGLRVVSDFDYEFQMALTNRKLSPEVETVFLMPREDYFYLSSRLIKELAALGSPVSCFVPPVVEKELRKKLVSREKGKTAGGS